MFFCEKVMMLRKIKLLAFSLFVNTICSFSVWSLTFQRKVELAGQRRISLQKIWDQLNNYPDRIKIFISNPNGEMAHNKLKSVWFNTDSIFSKIKTENDLSTIVAEDQFLHERLTFLSGYFKIAIGLQNYFYPIRDYSPSSKSLKMLIDEEETVERERAANVAAAQSQSQPSQPSNVSSKNYSVEDVRTLASKMMSASMPKQQEDDPSGFTRFQALRNETNRSSLPDNLKIVYDALDSAANDLSNNLNELSMLGYFSSVSQALINEKYLWLQSTWNKGLAAYQTLRKAVSKPTVQAPVSAPTILPSAVPTPTPSTASVVQQPATLAPAPAQVVAPAVVKNWGPLQALIKNLDPNFSVSVSASDANLVASLRPALNAGNYSQMISTMNDYNNKKKSISYLVDVYKPFEKAVNDLKSVFDEYKKYATNKTADQDPAVLFGVLAALVKSVDTSFAVAKERFDKVYASKTKDDLLTLYRSLIEGNQPKVSFRKTTWTVSLMNSRASYQDYSGLADQAKCKAAVQKLNGEINKDVYLSYVMPYISYLNNPGKYSRNKAAWDSLTKDQSTNFVNLLSAISEAEDATPKDSAWMMQADKDVAASRQQLEATLRDNAENAVKNATDAQQREFLAIAALATLRQKAAQEVARINAEVAATNATNAARKQVLNEQQTRYLSDYQSQVDGFMSRVASNAGWRPDVAATWSAWAKKINDDLKTYVQNAPKR